MSKRTEQVEQVMKIVTRRTFELMDETGCTLDEAMNAAARWIFDEYPMMAAAITLEAVAA